jgi:hypothetical protein
LHISGHYAPLSMSLSIKALFTACRGLRSERNIGEGSRGEMLLPLSREGLSTNVYTGAYGAKGRGIAGHKAVIAANQWKLFTSTIVLCIITCVPKSYKAMCATVTWVNTLCMCTHITVEHFAAHIM